jgi:hypothetical protein
MFVLGERGEGRMGMGMGMEVRGIRLIPWAWIGM